MKTALLLALLLQAPTAGTSTISGRVIALPNTPVPSKLALRTVGDPSGAVRDVAVNADGTFEIRGVTPGEYDLNIVYPERTFEILAETFPSHYLSMVPIDVGPGRNFTFRNGDVTNFEIKVPVVAAGRVVIPNATNVPNGIMIESTSGVNATNANSGRRMTSRVTADAAGNFRLPLFPGENSISFPRVPAGFRVQAIAYGNLDLQRNPLRIDAAPTSTIVITLERAQ